MEYSKVYFFKVLTLILLPETKKFVGMLHHDSME